VVAEHGAQILLMSRVRLVHWNADECPEKAELLQSAGHEVVHGGEYRDWRHDPVDAVVIDLSRLPSHGREVAAGLRGAKATRHIPIVFVEGAPEKVDKIRQLLPDAVYTTWPKVQGALKKLKPVTSPVVPQQMMDRYASRTTAQKLGVKERSTVTVIDPPRDYAKVLGDLPAHTEINEDPDVLSPVTVCFVRDPEALPEILELGRKIAGKTRFWICWQKGKKTGFNDIPIRNAAVALGLVDYKVCSLDPTWSGLVFAMKKAR
jgi:CheY-like chemotaxis protein